MWIPLTYQGQNFRRSQLWNSVFERIELKKRLRRKRGHSRLAVHAPQSGLLGEAGRHETNHGMLTVDHVRTTDALENVMRFGRIGGQRQLTGERLETVGECEMGKKSLMMSLIMSYMGGNITGVTTHVSSSLT